MADATHRCVALVGPYLSGKTTLLEALLFASGTTSRRGSVRDGNSVGDHVAEARARQMSTEINVANATFLGDPWTILDCPGSVELLYEAQQAMLAADVAVVVCEPEVERAVTVSALLRFLDRHNIPHMIFINKLDTASARVRDVLAALQSYSERPLVLRQVPLRGERRRDHRLCRSGQRARLQLPPGPGLRSDPAARRVSGTTRRDTRTSLVEKLADFDDALLEQLLEDVQPSKEEIYEHLTKDCQHSADRAGVCRRRRCRITACAGCGRRCATRRRARSETAARLGIAADRRAAGPGLQDLSPAAYRQAVAGAGLARHDLGRQRAQRRRASPASCALIGAQQEKVAVGAGRRGRRA